MQIVETKEGLLNKIAQTSTAKPLLEYYAMELEEQTKALIVCKDEVTFRHIQGKCQWLSNHVAALKQKIGV